MTEFSSARLDYLVRRVERPGEMTEIFEGRCDRLYRRHVIFERQVDGAEQDGAAGTEMKIPQVPRGGRQRLSADRRYTLGVVTRGGGSGVHRYFPSHVYVDTCTASTLSIIFLIGTITAAVLLTSADCKMILKLQVSC